MCLQVCSKWYKMVTKWEIVVEIEKKKKWLNKAIKPHESKNMLIGEYTHSQDDKKRISLPSKFKKEIGKKVVVTHGLDNCLFMFSIKEWVKISEKLGSLSMGQAGSRGFNRMFLGGAVEIDVDNVGRILVPDFLREYAGLSDKTGKVVFTGVYNKVEIWDETRWKNFKMENLKHVDEIAEKLGEVGVI